ncbi:MAG: phage holin family protein [Bacteroidia bacterium]
MEGKNKVEQLLKHAEEYAETRFDIAVLNMQEKTGNVLSSMASAVLVTVFSLFVILFASIGGAWLIGEYFKSPSIGFFSIAGFYLLLGLIIYMNREKWIKLPIMNALLRKINIHEED